MKSLGAGFVVAILFLASTASLGAQALRSTITFDNQSGEPALVKLVGPTAQTVEVPNREQRAVAVAAGGYYLLARYGADPRHYTYSRGDPFKVEETTTQSAVITITLHKVVGGNYPSRSASREEFDQASRPTLKIPPDQPATAAVTGKALERTAHQVVVIAYENGQEMHVTDREFIYCCRSYKGAPTGYYRSFDYKSTDLLLALGDRMEGKVRLSSNRLVKAPQLLSIRYVYEGRRKNSSGR